MGDAELGTEPARDQPVDSQRESDRQFGLLQDAAASGDGPPAGTTPGATPSSREEAQRQSERNQRSEPLDDGDGGQVVLAQEPQGPGNRMGSGEFPDPDTPPKRPVDAAREQDALDAGRRRPD